MLNIMKLLCCYMNFTTTAKVVLGRCVARLFKLIPKTRWFKIYFAGICNRIDLQYNNERAQGKGKYSLININSIVMLQAVILM